MDFKEKNMLIDGYVAEQTKKAMLNSEQEQVKIYDAYYNKGVTDGYNQALEDALDVVEWDGYTLDIKKRIEQLKR